MKTQTRIKDLPVGKWVNLVEVYNGKETRVYFDGVEQPHLYKKHGLWNKLMVFLKRRKEQTIRATVQAT